MVQHYHTSQGKVLVSYLPRHIQGGKGIFDIITGIAGKLPIIGNIVSSLFGNKGEEKKEGADSGGISGALSGLLSNPTFKSALSSAQQFIQDPSALAQRAVQYLPQQFQPMAQQFADVGVQQYQQHVRPKLQRTIKNVAQRGRDYVKQSRFIPEEAREAIDSGIDEFDTVGDGMRGYGMRQQGGSQLSKKSRNKLKKLVSGSGIMKYA